MPRVAAGQLVPGTKIIVTRDPANALTGVAEGATLFASRTVSGGTVVTLTRKAWHGHRGTYTLTTPEGDIVNVPPTVRLLTSER